MKTPKIELEGLILGAMRTTLIPQAAQICQWTHVHVELNTILLLGMYVMS